MKKTYMIVADGFATVVDCDEIVAYNRSAVLSVELGLPVFVWSCGAIVWHFENGEEVPQMTWEEKDKLKDDFLDF